jgi:hypothetical protein
MKRICKRSLLSHHVKWITVTAAWDVLRLRVVNMASIYTQYAIADSRQGAVLLLQYLAREIAAQ